MKNNTINDLTQLEILRSLEITENLIEKALIKENIHPPNVEIIAMPDLGLANNYIRMKGGFFTGMYASWESAIPFIPVDATVNSCGVSVFLLNTGISFSEFKSRVLSAKFKLKNSSYNWNYERGNHFISVCQLNNGLYCVIMHSSADEYKRSIPNKSLYPEESVWYYNNLHIVASDDGNRFLRYLTGKEAEYFSEIAVSLKDINHFRMKYMADLLFHDILDKELLYVPHYGMPTTNSIAIGCSWSKKYAVLLTAPGRDIYIVKSIHTNDNAQWLMPHGLGTIIDLPCISFKKKQLIINKQLISSDTDIANLSGKKIRFTDSNFEDYQHSLNQILKKCNATIELTARPLFSINKDGFKIFNVKKEDFQ